MNSPTHMPRLKGFRYPSEIIAYAVWTYHRFALSTADVEDLLAARGVIVSREAARLWVNRFGQHFANCIRRDRPRPNNKWHIDEVVITIRGRKHWLWRAIDANGDVPDIRVQTRRNARRFAASYILGSLRTLAARSTNGRSNDSRPSPQFTPRSTVRMGWMAPASPGVAMRHSAGVVNCL